VSRFQFVADHRHAFEVKRLCELVEVARSSFYAWLAGEPRRQQRTVADAELAERIRQVHDQDRALGAPRITAELNDGAAPDRRVNHKRVARVMREHHIAGLRLRRRVRTTIPEPADQRVPDLLRRDFTAAAPNQRYVGDITYLPLADGSNLYLATVIDCFSRRLAGWAIAEHMRTDLVTDALDTARDTRGSLAGAIFHSDHGAQAVQREDLRRALPATRRDPVDGRGRYQRRQRAGRVVQRLAQARDAAGRARVARPGDMSASSVRLGEPLQHPPPPLLLRPTSPDRLRTATRRYAAACRLIDHPVSTIRGQGPRCGITVARTAYSPMPAGRVTRSGWRWPI
jgi:transposase InsO family protein